MRPFHRDPSVILYHGDCLDILPLLPADSVHAVVTDPPYGLEFMGKEWDAPWKGSFASHAEARTRRSGEMLDERKRRYIASGVNAYEAGPGYQAWCEQWARHCLRVLKPGGHMLAFGGTRTTHRLTVAIEDAGFEIRDSIGYGSGVIAWCYGSGFPKSLNVSKDPRFCQCLPGVRDTATDQAAESAAQILLEDLRGSGQAEFAGITSLHGVRVDVHPDYEGSSRPQQDMLTDLCGPGDFGCEDRQTVDQRPASDSSVHELRNAGETLTQPDPAEHGDVLQPPLRRDPEDGATGRQPFRPDRDEADTPLRGRQPGMEGRGDLQAAEGQLPKPPIRPLPPGVPVDGPHRRLRDGTPASDGPVDRPPADPQRMREPPQPRPARQPPGKPRAVSHERRPQTWRGWPICPGCSKPRIPPGLGTALKPAWEPITLARKPLQSTVAGNVQAWGTGALNIDACRVGTSGASRKIATEERDPSVTAYGHGLNGGGGERDLPFGRWPPNVALDHTQAAQLDRESGTTTSRSGGTTTNALGIMNDDTWQARELPRTGHDDAGGASRYFPTFHYEPKAPTTERPTSEGGAHPTVKPLDLIRWLARLITPPGGVILDPFLGTGTTAEAAIIEGFRCIGIERDQTYLRDLCAARLAKPIQPVLGFGNTEEVTGA